MQVEIYPSRIAAVALMMIILGSGCTSAPVERRSAFIQPSSSEVQQSGIFVKQDPMTGYMRSQEGTPNELSPIAPHGARNVRKAGNYWLCDMNGQTLVFNSTSSRWEPQK
jgi:hypothetical protein